MKNVQKKKAPMQKPPRPHGRGGWFYLRAKRAARGAGGGAQGRKGRA